MYINGSDSMKIKIDKVISEGLVYGRTKKIKNRFFVNKRKSTDVEKEIQIFDSAIKKSTSQLDELLSDENFADEEFITVHKMILTDPLLRSNVLDSLNSNHYKANKAFNDVMDQFIENLDKARTVYLQERKLDLLDIKQRVLGNMRTKEYEVIDEDFIAIVDELVPSFLVFYKDRLKGIIAKSGGYTSHSAIICKTREIPYVICQHEIDENKDIIIDTRTDSINVAPGKDEIDEYKELQLSRNLNKKITDFSMHDVNVLFNVSNNDEIKKVFEYNVSGVGLYRTEMIFMNLDRAMTYEEQYFVYSEAVEMLKDKSLCFRTFDIGDDKQLSYIKTHRKGIDNYRNNKELFVEQIKALLNANIYGNMKIMFPMIETYNEFIYLRDWVYAIKKEINNNYDVQIGMMLETKAAIDSIDQFKDVDFISIGTNDLTKELYEVDRDGILDYSLYIDDLINRLAKVVTHCNDNSISLSICGELAGIKDVVIMLYNIGVKNYSVSASNAKTLEKALKCMIEVG